MRTNSGSGALTCTVTPPMAIAVALYSVALRFRLLFFGMNIPPGKNVFPSLQRRGGRAAAGVVSHSDHPVCANKERDHFLDGAASPPLQGGESVMLSCILQAPLN